MMMRDNLWHVMGVGVVLVALVAGGYFGCAVTSAVIEDSEPVAHALVNGERQLREPMRPITEEPRVVVVALDGVGADTFRTMLDEESLPRIAELVGEPRGDSVFEHGYMVDDVLSTLPATTMANWSTVLTGVGPAEHGVAANEWFDRRERRFYGPAPTSATGRSDTLRMLSSGLLGDVIDRPTVFERADRRSYVSQFPVYRGADLLVMPGLTALTNLFASVSPRDGASFDKRTNRAIDELGVDAVLEVIDKHGLADLQLVYFPGIDLYTHFTDQPQQSMRRYVENVIDPAVGRVIDAYDERGVLDDTHFVFVSDHGHTPVRNDHVLSTSLEHDPPAVIEAAGFRMRDFDVGPTEGDFQATVSYQGGIAFVYLADRSQCQEQGVPCNWSDPPRLEEDVLPVAQAFYESNQRGEPVAKLQDSLELVLARKGSAAGEDGEAFQVFDGEQLVAVDDYLEANPMPYYPRLGERLQELAVGPHGHKAGDILLMSRMGNHDLEDRYYFSGSPNHSCHGSAHRMDSEVPLLIAHRQVEGHHIKRRVDAVVPSEPSLVDVSDLILDLLAPRSR